MNYKGRNWRGTNKKGLTKHRRLSHSPEKGSSDQPAQAYKIIQITKGPVKMHNQQAAQAPGLRSSFTGRSGSLISSKKPLVDRWSWAYKNKNREGKNSVFQRNANFDFFFCSGGRSGLIFKSHYQSAWSKICKI